MHLGKMTPNISFLFTKTLYYWLLISLTVTLEQMPDVFQACSSVMLFSPGNINLGSKQRKTSIQGTGGIVKH